MELNQSASTPLSRITVIDALRGFALLGVILMHMSQHYGIFSFSGVEPREALFPQLDSMIQWFSRNVIMGKFINIFAFLFGMSFFIQMDKASKKGIDFRKRFLWRMVILFVIGVIGNCFYTGDILSIYAVFGVIMVVLFPLKNWMLMTIVSLLLIGAPRIITTGYNQIVKTEQVETTLGRESAPRSSNATIEKPSFFKSAQNNLTSGLRGKLNYQFGMFGRGYLTMALFIMGLIVGRLRFFEEINTHKRRNIRLLVGLIAATILTDIVINLLPETQSPRMFSPDNVPSPVTFAVMALRDIYSVLFSGALVVGFILLYQIKEIGKYMDVMTPYGRMGLTNYVAQSIIGAIIFSMWGFGSIFGGMGATEVFILGLIIYTAQIIVSKYWLKYHLYGPLEWFWRSATYFKMQPLKKKI